MASMVMTAVLCIVCLLAWRARQRSGAARTHGAIMALTGLAYIAWLGHWNLLGFGSSLAAVARYGVSAPARTHRIRLRRTLEERDNTYPRFQP
jgi:hypothetical protein